MGALDAQADRTGVGTGEDWRAVLAARSVDVATAVGHIRSGMTVGSGHFAGEPATLLTELCRQGDRLQDVKLYHMNGVTPGAYEYAAQPGWSDRIRHYSLFAGAQTRRAVQEHRADFVPCFFSEIPRLFREHLVPVDACFVQLSMPDDDGYCSYGVSCDYGSALVESSPLVIAELNAQMPYTYGERVHVSKLDVIVQTDRPLMEVTQVDPGADSSVAEAIAQHIAALIPDGANLQLGIGAIPDMVLKYLTDKRDLGVHTEMFSDGILDLVDAGVLTCAANNLHPGRIVATFIGGTQRLYDWVDRNPMVLMRPVDYTNNILVAGRVDRLVSINSAVQVNFHGEVAADTIGHRQFSGVGGQVDFVRAASASKGGFSVIAMPSTAKRGTVSRIVAQLDPGACVTTSRNDVHWIATEYGAVCLRGKSIRERTEALIEIAHPDFREELRAQAAALGMTTVA